MLLGRALLIINRVKLKNQVLLDGRVVRGPIDACHDLLDFHPLELALFPPLPGLPTEEEGQHHHQIGCEPEQTAGREPIMPAVGEVDARAKAFVQQAKLLPGTQ